MNLTNDRVQRGHLFVPIAPNGLMMMMVVMMMMMMMLMMMMMMMTTTTMTTTTMVMMMTIDDDDGSLPEGRFKAGSLAFTPSGDKISEKVSRCLPHKQFFNSPSSCIVSTLKPLHSNIEEL